MGELILIPWHIGSRADITFSAVRALKRLRLLLAEDAKAARGELEAFGLGRADRTILRIPHGEDEAFLKRLLARLAVEDAGLMASGGAPCLVDPGGWVVRRVRQAGRRVVPLGGASALTTVLSMSGLPAIETASFAFYLHAVLEGSDLARFLRVVRRRDEPVVVFVNVPHLRRCLNLLARVVPKRPLTLFFDLTKGPSPRFPHANDVRTLPCRLWPRAAAAADWSKVSDVALLLEPAPKAVRRAIRRGNRSPCGRAVPPARTHARRA